MAAVTSSTTVSARICKPGKFMLHRSTSGAAATDSATYSDANYVPGSGFSTTGARSIWVVWTGTGGAAGNTIGITALIRDNVNVQWHLLPEITCVKDTMKELLIYGANEVFLAISTVSGTTATALQVSVALADSAIVE